MEIENNYFLISCILQKKMYKVINKTITAVNKVLLRQTTGWLGKRRTYSK